MNPLPGLNSWSQSRCCSCAGNRRGHWFEISVSRQKVKVGRHSRIEGLGSDDEVEWITTSAACSSTSLACAESDPKLMQPIFSEFEAILKKYEPRHKITVLVGADFYSRVKACYAIVASGERRLYGNLILRKGVIHPA